MRVLIVGCGYVGLPLGTTLAQQGHQVFGLRRTDRADALLRAAGIQPLHADVSQARTLADLPRSFDWVVNTVSSTHGGPEQYRRVYLDGTRHLLEWLASAPPARFVYTSSTGVYGQNDGSMVDETSPTEPESETGRLLVQTENLLLQAARERGFPAVILRLAGIYGPDRGHYFKQFVSGQTALADDGRRVLNMVHRDDVVGAVIAALERGQPGAVFNVVDDEPVTQWEFYCWLADQLGRPRPGGPGASPPARSRGLTNKIVSNRKLKTELGYQFKYPTFREGYAGAVAGARSGSAPSSPVGPPAGAASP